MNYEQREKGEIKGYLSVFYVHFGAVSALKEGLL